MAHVGSQGSPNYSVTECWPGQCALWALLMEMQWGVLKSLLILSPNFPQVPVCPCSRGPDQTHSLEHHLLPCLYSRRTEK